MYIFKLPNAAASKISVTSTATLLSALIDTAGGTPANLMGKLNAIDIVVEDGDIRVLFEGNVPTALNGVLLENGTTASFRGVPLSKMRLIRAGGADVACSVQVGQADPSESTVVSTPGGGGGGGGDATAANQASQIVLETTIASAVHLEDAVAVSGDAGTAALAVRNDAGTALAADGDYTNLQTDSLGRLRVTGGGTSNVDDSAFTVATDSIVPTGLLADETATDSIDEGDVGLPRMTLNRRQINASETSDDAAPETGTKPSLGGFVFDDTAPDSVDEGDAGYGRMSANRNQYETIRDAAGNERGVNVTAANELNVLASAQPGVDVGDVTVNNAGGAAAVNIQDGGNSISVDGTVTFAAEDLTNDLLQTVVKPLAVADYSPELDTSAAVEASSVTKASAGNLYGVTFSNGNAATRYLQFFNSATVPADATVPVITIACGQTVAVEWPKGRFFSTGIAWCNSSTQNSKTIGAADSLADVSFK